ncbi:MAG TPA: DUF6498-containing protein [Bacteroidota bacterium]
MSAKDIKIDVRNIPPAQPKESALSPSAEAQRAQSGSPQLALLDILTFLASMVITYALGWSTKDLVWSFWTSSLISGSAIQLYMKLAPAYKRNTNAAEWAFTAIGTIFGMAFFSVHFGAFHYVFASMLDMFMPLTPHPGRVYVGHLTWQGDIGFDFFATLSIAVFSYWPFALISIAHDYKAFQTVPAKDQYFEPYKKILRIFFVMFLLGGLYELGLESFLSYTLILVLYFAPYGFWGWLFFRVTGINRAELEKAAEANAEK